MNKCYSLGRRISHSFSLCLLAVLFLISCGNDPASLTRDNHTFSAIFFAGINQENSDGFTVEFASNSLSQAVLRVEFEAIANEIIREKQNDQIIGSFSNDKNQLILDFDHRNSPDHNRFNRYYFDVLETNGKFAIRPIFVLRLDRNGQQGNSLRRDMQWIFDETNSDFARKIVLESKDFIRSRNIDIEVRQCPSECLQTASL